MRTLIARCGHALGAPGWRLMEMFALAWIFVFAIVFLIWKIAIGT